MVKQLSEEAKGFIIGATVSIATSVAAMYVFYRYIAEKAATSAVEKYRQEYGIMNKKITSNSLLEWKPLSNDEISNIRNSVDNN